MSWRIWLPIVTVLCFTIGYVLCWFYRLPFVELEKEMQVIKASGEPIRYEEIVPPVSPSLSAEAIYQQAFRSLPKFPEGTTEKEQQAFADFLYGRPADETIVRRILERSRNALALVKRATQLPHTRLVKLQPYPYDTQLRYPPSLRSLIRLLKAEALLYIREGNADKALTNCVILLKMAQHLDEEPIELHVSLIAYIFQTTADLVKHICEKRGIPPQWAYRLMQLVSDWDGDRTLVRCLQIQRAFHVQSFEFLRSSPKMAREVALSWSEGCCVYLGGNIAGLMQPLNRQLAVNELIVLRFDHRLLEIAVRGEPYDWDEFKELDKFAEQVKKTGFAFKFPSFLNGFAFRPLAMAGELLSPAGLRAERDLPESAWAFEVISEAKVYQRLLQVTIALSLYRRKFGSYPNSLSELVPRFLPNVPKDPFDGKPLRYRGERQGFKVWSVGSNLKDENGAPRSDICLSIRL